MSNAELVQAVQKLELWLVDIKDYHGESKVNVLEVLEKINDLFDEEVL